MSKDNKFIGQHILNQLIKLVDKDTIQRISNKCNANYYTKKFDGYNHFCTMLYAVMKGFTSLREVCINLLADKDRLYHLGINYCVNKSTLSDANKKRSSLFFAEIYKSVYKKYKHILSDSNEGNLFKSLYIIDSTTIQLFKEILKGTGKLDKDGKKKGAIKMHTMINAIEDVPQLIIYTPGVVHDHLLMKEINLVRGSYIVFDRGYVDYAQHERYTEQGIYYVTKQKDNAVYESLQELPLPLDKDETFLKDEIIELKSKNKPIHKARRIAYWDEQKKKVIVYVTNNFELEVGQVKAIYDRRWQIESLFKRLKQNFPLRYFLGDNVNAIEIQIWSVLIANLLMTVIKKTMKSKKMAFTTMVSLIRTHLTYYYDLLKLLNNPENYLKKYKGTQISPPK